MTGMPTHSGACRPGRPDVGLRNWLARRGRCCPRMANSNPVPDPDGQRVLSGALRSHGPATRKHAVRERKKNGKNENEMNSTVVTRLDVYGPSPFSVRAADADACYAFVVIIVSILNTGVGCTMLYDDPWP